jgi:hypothetical protein
MMKQSLFSFALLNVIFLAGCGTTRNATVNDSDSAKKEVHAFTGVYQSSTGVMTPLSCYCSEGGTLTVPENGVIHVCFDKLTEKPEDCTQLAVFGHFETIANEPEETNPCPKGTMEVFVVESFKCK